MKRRHHPGTKQKTLCGHEATKQEYLQMVKGHNVTCITCERLFKTEEKEKAMIVEESHNHVSQQHA